MSGVAQVSEVSVAVGDSERLLLKACHQAYRRRLSQTEIAANLGISRFQVARLLQTALDEGYVTFNILEPRRWHSELETRLEEEFNLRTVIIVDGEDCDGEELRLRVADAAGRLLVEQVRDGSVVGVSLGATVRAMVEQLPERLPMKAEVVQLFGGLGQLSTEVTSITLAIDLARRFRTEPHLLLAPAVMNPAQRHDLLAHPELRDTVARFSQLDIAVLGVGALTDSESSRLLYGGLIDDKMHRKLLDQGAVADVLAYVLDSHGKVLKSGLEDRIVSIPLDVLRRTPQRIGVAAGWRKAMATKAAVLSGLINVLVTDSELASNLIGDRKSK